MLIDDHDTIRILKDLEWFRQQHGPRNTWLETREERIRCLAVFGVPVRRFAGIGAVWDSAIGRIHHNRLCGGLAPLRRRTFEILICGSSRLPDASKIARLFLRPCSARKKKPNQNRADHFLSPLTAGRCAASRSPSMQPY